MRRLRDPEFARGFAAMAGSCAIWGLSPMYFRLLSDVPALDVVSHRVVWSLLFFLAFLGIRGRLGELWAGFSGLKSASLLVLAAFLISVNWAVFIFSVQLGRVIDASMGYFVFPLVAVALGRLILGERMTRWQGAAVAISFAAMLAMFLGTESLPGIAAALALTFGLYSVIIKTIPIGPTVSITAEMLVALPLALVWLAVFAGNPLANLDLADFSASRAALLALSGPLMTALPLILMAYAAKRLTLGMVGQVQYLNPTLQFLVAVLVLSEPVRWWHMTAFPLVWLALAIYVAESRRLEKSA